MADNEPEQLVIARLNANTAQFMGDERKAIQIAEQAFVFYPQDKGLLTVLAMGYCRIGLFQKAHEYVSQLISLFPESAS